MLAHKELDDPHFPSTYRVSGDWSLGNRGPYVIGPVTKPTAETPAFQ